VVSLARALAEDLSAALIHEDGAPRSVLLWLDPDGQFTRLRDAVSGELRAMATELLPLDHSGSQFEIKMRLLEIEGTGGTAIVHLPGRSGVDLDGLADGRPPVLWAFVEYQYKGAIWGDLAGSREICSLTLDAWLIGKGVRFSGGGARAAVTADGPDSRLARFAAKNAFADLAQFPQPINLQTLNVVGDPRDLMIELLLDPEGAPGRWGDETKDVRELVASTFGLVLVGDVQSAWAEQLAMHLALVEAWDALGRAADFPFATRLPSEDRMREATLTLVRNSILPRSDVAGRLRSLVSRCSGELGGLIAWAVSRPGVPAAIPAIIDRRLAEILDAVAVAEEVGAQAGLAVLAERLSPIAAATRIDDRFGVLGGVAELGRLAAKHGATLDHAASAASMVDTYARVAWHVDDAYLRVVAACRDDATMAPARLLAGRVYAGYLDGVNQRFSDLAETAHSWPPQGVPYVRDIAADLWARPAKAKERRAVVIVDALRLDIAERTVERLGQTSELHVVAATLPTTTPFGMTALLPTSGASIGVGASSSTVQLFTDDTDSLEEREGRKTHLRLLLESRGDSVAFVEVEDLLQGGAVPADRFIVAFTYALDDRGHSKANTASLPEEALKLPARLALVVERLHASGVAHVDLVTDHGFLWLNPDDVDALGTPTVPQVQVTKKAPRYAILTDGAAAPELMHLPLPFDPSVQLGFPRGIRTLGKAAWYAHGGVSLQEAVIPHVVSRAAAEVRRVRAAFVVPVRNIVGATIPVRITPVVAGQEVEQLSFQAPQPMTVRLEVTGVAGGQALQVAAPVRVDVRADSPEQVTALYLSDGVKLAAGTQLTVAAFDDETGESLFEHLLPLVTDWE
jgi:PglZ domain